MRRLWIADPRASQRREIEWALRDRFDAIEYLDGEAALERALLVAGPFEEIFESRSGAWHLLAFVRGGDGIVVVLQADGIPAMLTPGLRFRKVQAMLDSSPLLSSAVKVLVVEDDRKLARFLQRVLSEEGYTADLCSSGRDALVQARSGIYNLVLLDWMIPDTDGLEVCRQLRRLGCTVPIMMLTARGELSERVLGFNAGADDFLVKPFEVEELVARVRALLRRAGSALQLKLGSLEIDREQRTVLVSNAPIELTTREFNLLLYLGHHAGRVVTRSELLAEVWSTQFETESNVVEVHISRLRDKLGESAEIIETVRGRGYCLRVPRAP